jgi:hypothetical protein
MAWSPYHTALNQILAEYYPEHAQVRRVLDEAGIPASRIALEGRAPIDLWHAVLIQAVLRNRVDALVEVATRDYPNNPVFESAKAGRVAPEPASRVDPHEYPEPTNAEYIEAETVTGAQSTLLPIGFLATGLKRARAVAMVRTPAATGTGFLIEGNILVTNNHAIPDPAVAARSTAVFEYEPGPDGAEPQPFEASLRPDLLFLTSPERRNDWTLVAVDGDLNARFGAIPLERVELGSTMYVNIIQHPYGGYKQIALYHNTVVRHDARLVQYLTDTYFGTSGAPVFDSSWRVVALHRGRVTEPVRSGRRAFRNVGTHINLVIERAT